MATGEHEEESKGRAERSSSLLYLSSCYLLVKGVKAVVDVVVDLRVVENGGREGERESGEIKKMNRFSPHDVDIVVVFFFSKPLQCGGCLSLSFSVRCGDM